MVYVGPAPVQSLKTDRRIMQKMSFSRKAEHDSVLSYIFFRENGVKSWFIQRERKRKKKTQCKTSRAKALMLWDGFANSWRNWVLNSSRDWCYQATLILALAPTGPSIPRGYVTEQMGLSPSGKHRFWSSGQESRNERGWFNTRSVAVAQARLPWGHHSKES